MHQPRRVVGHAAQPLLGRLFAFGLGAVTDRRAARWRFARVVLCRLAVRSRRAVGGVVLVRLAFTLVAGLRRVAPGRVLCASGRVLGLGPFRRGVGWVPEAVWFLGTGLGLLLLALMNLAHVGLGPCPQPTAVAVRYVNWFFVAFGVAAVVAVPEPQAYVVLAALLGQALAGTRTLTGPA